MCSSSVIDPQILHAVALRFERWNIYVRILYCESIMRRRRRQVRLYKALVRLRFGTLFSRFEPKHLLPADLRATLRMS